MPNGLLGTISLVDHRPPMMFCKKVLVYIDCSITRDPDSSQREAIASSCVEMAKHLLVFRLGLEKGSR